jgi:anti-sigma factor RsiW
MKHDQLSCTEAADSLHAYLDAMLDPGERATLDRHLAACPRCAAELARIRALESRLAGLLRETPAPPADLWEGVRPARDPGRPAFGRWQRTAVAAAVVAAVAVAALALGGLVQRFAARDARFEVALLETPLEELRAFVDSRRKLDLASTEYAAVREWFAGKVDYALPAPATRPEVKLVGARLCFFLDRRVASLMYQAEGRTLSLYVIPAEPAGLAARANDTVAGEPVVVHEARGYAQVIWRRGALVHALAADLPAARLVELSRDFVASTRPVPQDGAFALIAHAGAAAPARAAR